MTEDQNPFAVIAKETPAFPEEEAISVARDQFGLEVSARSLVSERDQNFQLLAVDGQQYVLKIANAAEPRDVTDFQIQALIHITDHITVHGTPIHAPRVLRTLDGDTQTILNSAGEDHVARVVSYVPGVPLGDRLPTVEICRNMGSYLAHLGNALRDFEHPGSDQLLLWDLQQALSLRDLLDHIPVDSARHDVEQALEAFEKHALPNLGIVRRQVIHGDFNPDNVLMLSTDSDDVVGVIDFGDMLEAPLVADLAIGASYARPQSGNPLALIAEFLSGYHRIRPLLQNEIDMLFELIKARLCASIAILYWRASFRDPGDAYLEKFLGAKSCGEDFLGQLTSIPREHAIQMFRQVCASAGQR